MKRTGQRRRNRVGFDKAMPVFVQQATEFTADPLMNNPDWVVQTINVLEANGELLPGLFDTSMLEAQDGRPRMNGNYMKVACAYVASKKVGMETFWNDYGQNVLWKEAGFDHDPSRDEHFEHRPSYPTFYRRMTELEVDEMIERFEEAWAHLIRVARKHRPTIGRDIGIDTTAFQTPNRLYHACAPGKCPRAGRSKKRSPQPTLVDGISAQEVEDRRHEEAREQPAPTPEDEREERARRKSWIAKDASGREWRYRILSDGCVYRCLDVDAGVRKYNDGRAWTGGYDLPAVDFEVGGTMASVMFSASRREHAGVPALLRKLEKVMDGEMPETVAADRGFSIDKTYRFMTRRGITLVSPWRKPNRNVNQRWKERTIEYDEHGVPRCPECGGTTIQHGAGLGLVFRRGEPSIAFRCVLGTTQACRRKEPFHIRCEENWRLLIGLSRESERYHALRTAHKNLERTHAQRRRRSGVAGKDETGRMKRRGMQVQRLRAAIAGFLEWMYICLRHGWIGNHRYRNAIRVIQRSGRAAAEGLRARRMRIGLYLPYGPKAFKLGLAATPAVPQPRLAAPPGSP